MRLRTTLPGHNTVCKALANVRAARRSAGPGTVMSERTNSGAGSEVSLPAFLMERWLNLLLSYVTTMVLSFTRGMASTGSQDAAGEPRLSLVESIGLLAAATGLAAWQSELLVGAISAARAALGITEFFTGVVVVALVGNAAEHATAVGMAMQNRMNAAVSIANASSSQIALFVAPVLVFASLAFGHPLSLVFNPFEVVGLGLAVIAAAIVSLDGESTWAEGLQLVAVYLVLIVVFYFVPG